MTQKRAAVVQACRRSVASTSRPSWTVIRGKANDRRLAFSAQLTTLPRRSMSMMAVAMPRSAISPASSKAIVVLPTPPLGLSMAIVTPAMMSSNRSPSRRQHSASGVRHK
jgi:hypothetical protein